MDEGYMLEAITPEQKREMLEKAIERSTENGTWPILLAVIGMTLGLDDKEK